MGTRSERTILSHEGPPTKVRQPGIVFTVARPNGALKLEDAAKLLQLTVTDMRKLATAEDLWYTPGKDGTVYALSLGIRGKFIDTLAFDKFRQSLLKAERKAAAFRESTTGDL